MHPQRPTLPLRELAFSWLWALVIVVIAAGVALTVNTLRHKGLPLIRRAPFDLYTDCPELLGDLPAVTLDRLPEGDTKVVYMDSRMALPHMQEHIPGSLFMPMYPIDLPDFKQLKRLPKGTWIVVYGSDKLQNNKRLVTALMNAGVRGVHLLSGGIATWKAAGRKTVSHTPRTVSATAVRMENTLFIDARDEETYLEGQLKGSLNLPFDTTLPPDTKLLAQIKTHKGPVVVYDSGTKDEKSPALGVYADLTARGIQNVRLVSGGIPALTGAGFTLVKEAKGEDE